MDKTQGILVRQAAPNQPANEGYTLIRAEDVVGLDQSGDDQKQTLIALKEGVTTGRKPQIRVAEPSFKEIVDALGWSITGLEIADDKKGAKSAKSGAPVEGERTGGPLGRSGREAPNAPNAPNALTGADAASTTPSGQASGSKGGAR